MITSYIVLATTETQKTEIGPLLLTYRYIECVLEPCEVCRQRQPDQATAPTAKKGKPREVGILSKYQTGAYIW